MHHSAIGSKSTTATGVASVPATQPILADNKPHKKTLELYQRRDRVYQVSLNNQHRRHLELAHEKKREIEVMHKDRQLRMTQGPAAVFGPGYRGSLGSTGSTQPPRIAYPNDRKRPRRKKDTLVPIRLEVDMDGYKLRDTFTWNLNETLITPEQFAEVMCEDLQLPATTFAPHIARTIHDQLQDYYVYDGTTDMGGDGPENEEEENDGSEDPKRRNTELRMLIRLDITVGNRALLDQFEWDIACGRNDAEAFAAKLADELGLGGEFRTAIAHSIREQAHNYIKSLILVGYEFNGSNILDDELRHSFLPALKSITRDHESVERFTPAILELTDAEIDKLERDRMRDARRKRRQARGRRGIVLPDREPQKTCRTTAAQVPADDMADDTPTRGSTPTGGFDPPVMHSQRKSALKARMNIAAEAAMGTHHNTSPPVHHNSQGMISLSTGHRFPTMPGKRFLSFVSRLCLLSRAVGHVYPRP
ncbi:hypothetical protein BX666DRAFT_1855571 [Dichotomocladium elegans]|nr:hypothetical protein BX666DRAFT_1855571 [Dichotomocladium elegans]